MVKVVRTVLRGERGSNPSDLPGYDYEGREEREAIGGIEGIEGTEGIEWGQPEASLWAWLFYLRQNLGDFLFL